MKGRNRGKSFKGNKIEFGDIAIKATEAGRIDSRQIEASRITMTRKINRTGKTWIRVFPDKPLTAKPLETRMGKGKGAVDRWVMNIKPGRIIFEILLQFLWLDFLQNALFYSQTLGEYKRKNHHFLIFLTVG